MALGTFPSDWPNGSDPIYNKGIERDRYLRDGVGTRSLAQEISVPVEAFAADWIYKAFTKRHLLEPSTLALSAEQLRKVAKILHRLNHTAEPHADLFQSLYEVRQQRTIPTPPPTPTPAELINSIRCHPGIRYGQRLAERLEGLLAIAREEQPEQAPPATASLKSMIAFLTAHPELAYPSTVLTTAGNVRAQWRINPRQHFAIEFLDDSGGDVRFVIFAPDPTHPYKTIRASGGATLDSVMRLAEPYGVLRWASEQPTEEEAK